MSRHDRCFLAAIEALLEYGFEPRLRAHVGAVIMKGGSVISVAVNTPGVDHYSLIHTHNKFIDSTHAEVNAILKIRHKVDLTDTKMWVARLTKPDFTRMSGSKVGLAAPCQTCKKIIARHGIKKVYYTIDKDTMATWRPIIV